MDELHALCDAPDEMEEPVPCECCNAWVELQETRPCKRCRKLVCKRCAPAREIGGVCCGCSGRASCR